MTSHHKNNKLFYKITRLCLLSLTSHVKWAFGNIWKKIHCKVQIHIPFTIPKTPCFNIGPWQWKTHCFLQLFIPCDKIKATSTQQPLLSVKQHTLFVAWVRLSCFPARLAVQYTICFTIPNVIALVSVWSDVLSQVLHELCLHHVPCRPTCSMV